MAQQQFGDWQQMRHVPRDGTRVLVAIRATEQGPAEVDVARWARADRAGDLCWVSADSAPDCPIGYEDAELVAWMPLPGAMPRLRAGLAASGLPEPPPREDEGGGSGI